MDRILDTVLVAPARSRRGVLRRLLALADLRRSRRALLDLDAHLLRDIGLTRAEAIDEGERPVWDAPAHWRL